MSDREGRQSAGEDDMRQRLADRLALPEDEHALHEVAGWGPTEDWSDWADAPEPDRPGCTVAS